MPGPRSRRIACLCILILCAHFKSSGLADAQTPAAGAVTLAPAADDPHPMIKILREHAEDKVVDLLGAHPLGKIPVAVYKTADLAREVGVAATEREDASLGASMVLINADAALIKGMVAQGVDLDHDPRAAAARQRLRNMVLELDSTGESALGHLGGVTMKHLPYAMAKVGIDKAISAGIGKAVKWAEPGIDKALPIGDEVKSVLGNRSGLASGLRYIGWKKLGARADLAKKYTDELMHKLIQSKLDELVKAELKKAFGGALDDLYREVMEDHPSQLRRTVVSRPALYAPLVVQAMPAAPAVALPVAAPAVAAPAPAAAVAAPVPMPPVIQTSRDRVVNNLYVDDSYMRWSKLNERRERSEPARETAPSPPPEPEPKHEKSAWEIRLHQELMCVGAGNKPGCGSWDGNRGGSLYGR